MDKLRTLTRASDFERVFREGRRYRSREILLFVRLREEPGLRVAFLTAKGVGNAVQRNRLRRRLREACRALWPGIAVVGADCLLMGLAPAVRCDAGSLRRAVADLLREAGVAGVTDAAD